MTMMDFCFYDSPLGIMKITANGESVTGLDFVKSQGRKTIVAPALPVLQNCIQQLDDYFSGQRKVFDISVKLNGTPFQQRVWRALQKIPHGHTCSYADLAKKIGSPKSCRAVGGANHKNKIAIIIPCHRVIGADGSLTGYAGGLKKKSWLLQHEKSQGRKSL